MAFFRFFHLRVLWVLTDKSTLKSGYPLFDKTCQKVDIFNFVFIFEIHLVAGKDLFVQNVLIFGPPFLAPFWDLWPPCWFLGCSFLTHFLISFWITHFHDFDEVMINFSFHHFSWHVYHILWYTWWHAFRPLLSALRRAYRGFDQINVVILTTFIWTLLTNPYNSIYIL